ncbi:hypothetical protein BJV77DRAFT_1122950 [Russula vinacea]|nr:hypothetical protein BJV77DRAFT_1122950 [Russula vinacea]
MTNASNTMHIKIGFVHLANSTTQSDIVETYNAPIKHFRLSLVSALPARTVSATLLARVTHDICYVAPMTSFTLDDLSPPYLTPTPSPTAAPLPPAQQVDRLVPIECRDPDRERRKVVGRGEQKSGAFELEADHERFPVSFGKRPCWHCCIEIAELAATVPKKDPDTGLKTKTAHLPVHTSLNYEEILRESKRVQITRFRTNHMLYGNDFCPNYSTQKICSHYRITNWLRFSTRSAQHSAETIDLFFTRWDKNPSRDVPCSDTVSRNGNMQTRLDSQRTNYGKIPRPTPRSCVDLGSRELQCRGRTEATALVEILESAYANCGAQKIAVSQRSITLSRSLHGGRFAGDNEGNHQRPASERVGVMPHMRRLVVHTVISRVAARNPYSGGSSAADVTANTAARTSPPVNCMDIVSNRLLEIAPNNRPCNYGKAGSQLLCGAMIHDKWRMVLLQYQSAKAEWISFSYKRDNLKVVEVTSKSFDLVTSHSHLPAPPFGQLRTPTIWEMSLEHLRMTKFMQWFNTRPDHEDSPGGTSSPFDQGNEDELRKLNLASQGQSSRVSPQQLEYVPGAHPFEPGLDRKAEAPDFGKFQWIPEMGVAQSSEDRMMDSKEWPCPHDGCNKRYRRRQEAVRHMRDKHETPPVLHLWDQVDPAREDKGSSLSKHWDNFTEEERQEIRHLHGLINTIDVLERLRIAMLPRSYKP